MHAGAFGEAAHVPDLPLARRPVLAPVLHRRLQAPRVLLLHGSRVQARAPYEWEYTEEEEEVVVVVVVVV